MKVLEVASAIIVRDNKILCAKRGESKHSYVSGKFEFPGGKLEAGESPRAALHRELVEEMNIDIPIETMEEFCTVHYQYPDFAVNLHCFICRIGDQSYDLKEHVEIQWRTTDNLGDLDWIGADTTVLEMLREKGV